LKLPDEPLGPLKRKDGDPTFDEPWQAQALAMADTLVVTGKISAAAWAETLGAELRKAADTGAPDDTETYYRAVLAALERLLNQSGAAEKSEIDARRDQWERAYLNTPHGQPVQLSAGEKA
jgi:nitrile hydratase accessory protein